MKKKVLLFSGGMDSLVAWEYLGRPDMLYAMLGHKYEEQELSAIKELFSLIYEKERYNALETLHFSGALHLQKFEDEGALIPLRNLYLCMLAVNLGYDIIYLTVQEDEMLIPDRTPLFFEEASKLLTNLSGRSIKIETPFAHMDKTDMVKWYIDNKKDLHYLKSTWACYFPVKDKPCFNCPACFRRFVAMSLNGIIEEGAEGMRNSEIASHYLHSVENNHYSPKRSKRIRDSLNRGVPL